MLLTVLFAMALSLDSFGVGISYGLRQIRLPFAALLIICTCSGMMLAISMAAGRLFSTFLSPHLVQYIGAGILIVLGGYLLWRNMMACWEEEYIKTPLLQWNIRHLGVVIQILREPQKADIDKSGMISSQEAVWLGLALSLDSFGAGIGMALLGFHILPTSCCIALSALLFVSVGMCLGGRLGDRLSYQKVNVLPGILLILVGVLRLLL